MSRTVFAGGMLAFWLCCLAAVVAMFTCGTSGPYPPEAAEAPDVEFERARPLTEVGPLVVAGSDLDLSEARVNLLFALLTLPYASDATVYERGVAGLYVAPEVDR